MAHFGGTRQSARAQRRSGKPGPTEPLHRADALLEAMTRDKKVADGRPRFVLARGIGQAFAGAEVEADQIRALLDAARP